LGFVDRSAAVVVDVNEFAAPWFLAFVVVDQSWP
jgi:hypothetical protein